MCLVLLGSNVTDAQPLIIAANRDEYHHRRSLALHQWHDGTGIKILSGIDVERGGTWLALGDNGRFAAVTNVRTGQAATADKKSRGELPLLWISCKYPSVFQQLLNETAHEYGPYNLVYGSLAKIHFFSSPDRQHCQLDTGIHGLSNASLNTPWPKVERGKARFEQALSGPTSDQVQALFQALADRHKPDDSALPSTGVSLDVERTLSAMFIQTPTYGTRSSSIVISNGTSWWCSERSYSPQGEMVSEKSLSLTINSSHLP